MTAAPATRKRAAPQRRYRLSRGGYARAWHLLGALRRPAPPALIPWAESHVVIPDGPHAGKAFSCDYQPFFGLFYRELQRRHWRRVFVTGCAQSGKTMLLLIVLLHALFARREKVVYGIPDFNMAADKWREDVLPIVRSSGYANRLPRRGEGSRGGGIKNAVRFRGAGTVKLMSFTGGDAKRSGYSARIVVATEVDKGDTPSAASDETDPIGQLEARTGSYGALGQFLGESTPSRTNGRIWREKRQGTDSRIVCPCPHCHEYVTPEREHLIGWQAAPDIVTAQTQAAFVCPACGVVLTEAERVEMNRAAVLLHRGQHVEPRNTDGSSETDQLRISGADPQTDTLTFRWNAFNNLFWDPAYVAGLEWRALHDPDPAEDNPEKYLRQFVWAVPYDPPELDLAGLEWKEIAARAVRIPRGTVPDGTVTLTAAIDLGKRMGCHWTVVATSQSASPHVVDYGCQEVEFAEVGLERALMIALRQLWDLFYQGWPAATGGQRRRPDVVLVDSGWQSDTVYAFMRQLQPGCGRWLPSKGFGWARQGRSYQVPKKLSQTVVLIGEHCHVSCLEATGVLLAEFDADHWKSYTHARAKTAAGEPGALSLFAGQPREHENYARQLTAEREVEKYDSRRGVLVKQWEQVLRRANHYLDSTSGALVAAYLAGVRMFATPPPPPAPKTSPAAPDTEERPWLATDRTDR